MPTSGADEKNAGQTVPGHSGPIDEWLKEALMVIEQSTRPIRHGLQGAERLAVHSLLPSFAMAVWIPALRGFVLQPAVAVEVVTSLSPPSVDDSDDVLIVRDLEQADADHGFLLLPRRWVDENHGANACWFSFRARVCPETSFAVQWACLNVIIDPCQPLMPIASAV